MKISLKSFALGFGCAAISLGAATYVSASSDKTIKACANKKTGAMRYISKGACKKTETALSWNQMGPQGLPGSAGTKGTAGAKGDTGAAGTKGDTGAAGAKGDTGAAGSSFSARSVCGADGATLCAVDTQGPGGGTVFFVDTEGKYSDFDYLEVAPTDASTGVAWSTTTPHCGLLANTSCQAAFVTTSGEAINYGAIGTGRAATAAIVARHDVGDVTKTDYAAGVADAYTTPTASDWWLPSFEELREVCKFALNVPPDETDCSAFEGSPTLRSGFSPGDYWSSSEWTVGSSGTAAWIQAFSEGSYGSSSKPITRFVRPVRGF
jgi:hypothetical protein